MILDEYNTTPNGTSCTLDPAIDRAAIVTCIIASIPSGTAGVLTIGTPGTGADRRQINITPGMAPMLGLSMFIQPSDVFSLTIQGGSGLISIEIMGGLLANQRVRLL